MRKRIVSAALSATLALSSLPFAAVPALAADGGNQFDTILKMDSVKPAGFDENSEENPYGQPKNQPFLLNTESELMVYRNKENGHDVDLGWYDTRVDSGLYLELNGNKNGFESAGLYGSSAVDVLKELYHVESVAFDPTGSGRKDHVAYIGHAATSEHDGEIVIVVVDTTQGNESATFSFENAGWMNGVQAWTGGNYLAITAGDYDGSGHETLVAHVLTNNYTYGLAQLSYDASSNKITCRSSQNKSLLHWKYVEENHGHELDDSTYEHDKMSADLATGDFNGDGIDDLAVVSYLNGGAGGEDNRNWDCAYFFPMLNVAYGASDGRVVFDNQQSGFCQLRREDRDGLRYKLTAPAAPGIAAGDVDGDGVDEIVVAGSKNTITSKTNSYDAADRGGWSINGESWVIITLNAREDGTFADPGGEAGTTTLSEVGSNAWFAGGTGGETRRSPMDIECVAMNGAAAAEYVFMGGALFDLSTSTPERLYTPGYFNEDDAGADDEIIDEVYLQSIVAGNFDGNEWGYEQVMYVIVLKDRNQNDYFYMLGMIGGKNYDGHGGPVGSMGGTDQTRFFDVKSDYIISDTGGGYRTTIVITPMDRDKDGVMARYMGKSYVYADPKVLAVLQMAPYFDEIDIGNDAGATTYTFTQTYEYTEGTSESKSYSIGGAFGVETPVVNVEAEAGYVNSWSRSFENTLTRSVTDSFTAKAYDSVVVYRTPIFNYNYQLMNKDGTEWVDLDESGITVSVPKTPTYVQMSVEDYNSFVGVYNAMMAEGTDNKYTPMEELDLSYLGQEGNPWGYGTSLDQVSNNTYQLGYNGGETSSASSTGQATTETIEQETGFSFEISATTGFNMGMFSVMAGVNYSLEKMAGNSTSKTTSSETETSGTVQDLDWKYLLEEYGIPESVTRSYGFTWNLGKDEVDLGAAGDKALVIGYNVSNISAPPPAVSELTARQADETSVDLSWVDPSVDGRVAVDGYNVYVRNEDGTYRKLNDKPLSKDALEYRVEGLESNTDYVFVVTTLSGGKESVWSNEAAIKTPKGMKALTLAYDDDEVELTASHLGNVDIQSGEKVPEETIVYVSVAPKDGYTITGVTLTQEGEEPESVNMTDGRFNFVMYENTSIEVTSEKVVDKSVVSYVDEVTDGSGNVTGTVEAHTSSGNEIDASGAEVSGPVEFVATPADGYALKEWHVSSSSGNSVIDAVGNELTFYPYENVHKVTPVFVPITDPAVSRTVTLSVGDGGQIEVKSGDSVLTPDDNGTITVARGTELTFTAMPDDFYNFIGWTDGFADYEDDTDSVTLRVLDSLTVGATFEADLLYTLEFDVRGESGGSGTLTASANGAQVTSGQKFVPDTQVDFAATADGGSRFLKWGVTEGTVTTFVPASEGLVTEDSYELTLVANSSVDAYFKTIETYDLEVPATVEHGSVVVRRGDQDVTPGTDSLSYGDVITINAVPNEGYILVGLTVNGEEFTPGETYLVTGPVSIGATIVENVVHSHVWGTPSWTWETDNSAATAHFACVCGEKRDVEATVTTAPEPDATCTDDGRMVVTAAVSFEGARFTDKRDGDVIPAIDHEWGEPTWEWSEDGSSATATFACAHDASHVQTVDATVTSRTSEDPTCTGEGVATYTAKVELGGKSFSDTLELGDIAPTGHTPKTEGARKATCASEGYTGDKVCSVCGALLGRGETIERVEHTPVTVGAREATCSAEGYTGDVVCSECDALLEKGETIAKADHRIVLVGAKEATTTSKGYTGDQVCSVCEEVVKEGEDIPALPRDSEVMYRLYNRWSGEHFYTSDPAERASLVGIGWTDEGVGWIAPREGAEVYRLYNPFAEGGDHHYTMDAEEYEALAKLGWEQEGVAWHSAGEKDEGARPLYRLFNPYEQTTTHHYTSDADERDALMKIGWRDEGVAWYGLSAT
ncbi:MAG TPA: fibronectin type III domain-containing protein [Candidatus Olsenella pullicola]|nr:fibronectin type III domain-containing protein [Candidatus Olsenella pullicola]